MFPTGCKIRMRAPDVEAETSPCGGLSGSSLSLDLTDLECDLTDVEWAQVAALIPPRQRGGRKRSVDVWKDLNGIFYMLAGVANGRRRRKICRRKGPSIPVSCFQSRAERLSVHEARLRSRENRSDPVCGDHRVSKRQCRLKAGARFTCKASRGQEGHRAHAPGPRYGRSPLWGECPAHQHPGSRRRLPFIANIFNRRRISGDRRWPEPSPRAGTGKSTCSNDPRRRTASSSC